LQSIFILDKKELLYIILNNYFTILNNSLFSSLDAWRKSGVIVCSHTWGF
jgi:hypothetical protein